MKSTLTVRQTVNGLFGGLAGLALSLLLLPHLNLPGVIGEALGALGLITWGVYIGIGAVK